MSNYSSYIPKDLAKELLRFGMPLHKYGLDSYDGKPYFDTEDEDRSPPTIYPYTQTPVAPTAPAASETLRAVSLSSPLPDAGSSPIVTVSPVWFLAVSSCMLMPPLPEAFGTETVIVRTSLALNGLVNNVVFPELSFITRLTLPGLKYAVRFSE